MEEPNNCFALNFLRSNITSAARSCCVRPAGASPERGQHTQPPTHTHTHQSLLHPPATSDVVLWVTPNAPPQRREPPRAREPADTVVGPQCFGCY